MEKNILLKKVGLILIAFVFLPSLVLALRSDPYTLENARNSSVDVVGGIVVGEGIGYFWDWVYFFTFIILAGVIFAWWRGWFK